MQYTRARAWQAMCVAIGALALPALGSTQSADLQVRAVIRSTAGVRVAARPDTIEVSLADVARGYTETDWVFGLDVTSNLPGGYLLVFETQHGGWAGGAEAAEAGNDGTFVAGAWQGTPAQGLRRWSLRFRFRFALRPSLPPGRYPWPVLVSLIPR